MLSHIFSIFLGFVSMTMVTIMGTNTLQSIVFVDRTDTNAFLLACLVVGIVAAYLGAWVCALGAKSTTARSRILYLLMIELCIGVASNITSEVITPMWYKVAILAAAIIGNGAVAWHFSSSASNQ